jgi:hypothetical protein
METPSFSGESDDLSAAQSDSLHGDGKKSPCSCLQGRPQMLAVELQRETKA